MDKLIISGPTLLAGEVEISKAKNAYLPILAAVLLSDKPVHLKNIPDLEDIKLMLHILSDLGVIIHKNNNITTLNAAHLNSHDVTGEVAKKIRASIFILGPLVARLKKAKIALPGGCEIGSRPIDLHLENLEKFGVKIIRHDDSVEATVVSLKPAMLKLTFPSVGATANLMMAAVFVPGISKIENAALEPEIDDLANFLNSMGALISGVGTNELTIEGVESLHEVHYEAIGDRIEAATYLMAALITDSEIKIKDINPLHLQNVIDSLKEMGANILTGEDYIDVRKSNLKGCQIETAPFPGFPTDAQAQMVALCSQIRGVSVIKENIFENRFMHVPELTRLGATITLEENKAIIHGEKYQKATSVMCTDLRAAAALIIAALPLQGETEVQHIYHLDRGYENLVDKFTKLGAKMTRVYA
jgi:UDP-N-acetylglucosamine 1-carboxyvinyltransferase